MRSWQLLLLILIMLTGITGYMTGTDTNLLPAIDDLRSGSPALGEVDHPIADAVQQEHPDCQPLRVHGDPADKADLLIVGKDYDSNRTLWQDVTYYMDFDGDNRGLFAIPPFDSHVDRFNIWVLDAGHAIADYNDPRTGRGLITDARNNWFPQCPFADYRAVFAKQGMGRSNFAYDAEMYVQHVHRARRTGDGARGFLHEWGHGFGGLKDEYYSADGRDASGQPNCAPSREQAEAWWGDIAAENDDVGYYQGCAYTAENWRPHEQSIMGNGGLHSYGPVNVRHMERILDRYS